MSDGTNSERLAQALDRASFGKIAYAALAVVLVVAAVAYVLRQ